MTQSACCVSLFLKYTLWLLQTIILQKFSAKQLNINTFISMLKVKFRCESFIANINKKMTKFLTKWTLFYNHFNNNQDQNDNNDCNNNNTNQNTGQREIKCIY